MGEIKNRPRRLINETETDDYLVADKGAPDYPSNQATYKWDIVWLGVAKVVGIHLAFLLSLPLIPFAKNATILFSYTLILAAVFGIQIGAHRLWTHRTFKANFPLRLVLAICQTISVQKDIFDWSRDHRVHHKWSDTDADPHNSTRGFFFSHCGWLMLKKHPEVIRRGATIDVSDLEADPIVRWQRKPYYTYLWVPIFWALLPTYIPVLAWGEWTIVSFYLCVVFRYVLTLNVTWLVNSWAHIYGTKPYNKELVPVEASIRHVMNGEGFHNYHHAFPWDYSTSELGPADVFNPATALIDFFAYMGWVWDLKKPEHSAVEKTRKAKGEAEAPKYERGKGLREWTIGMTIQLSPIWALLLYKYIYLFFYYIKYDSPPNFEFVKLYNFAKI